MHHENIVRTKISVVLRNFRKKPDALDIPMIVKYRKQDYMSELNESDIWAIFNLDLEYGKF